MGALVLLGHTPVATLVVSALMAGQLVYRRGEQLRAYTAAAGLLGACAVLAG